MTDDPAVAALSAAQFSVGCAPDSLHCPAAERYPAIAAKFGESAMLASTK
jgi:hypothetical protein